jgi:hypothetical protein
MGSAQCTVFSIAKDREPYTKQWKTWAAIDLGQTPSSRSGLILFFFLEIGLYLPRLSLTRRSREETTGMQEG